MKVRKSSRYQIVDSTGRLLATRASRVEIIVQAKSLAAMAARSDLRFPLYIYHDVTTTETTLVLHMGEGGVPTHVRTNKQAR